jgi:hypothetical protein
MRVSAERQFFDLLSPARSRRHLSHTFSKSKQSTDTIPTNLLPAGDSAMTPQRLNFSTLNLKQLAGFANREASPPQIKETHHARNSRG